MRNVEFAVILVIVDVEWRIVKWLNAQRCKIHYLLPNGLEAVSRRPPTNVYSEKERLE